MAIQGPNVEYIRAVLNGFELRTHPCVFWGLPNTSGLLPLVCACSSSFRCRRLNFSGFVELQEGKVICVEVRGLFALHCGMWWVFAHGVGARRMIRYVISITLPTETFPLWHSVSPACAKYHIVPAMASNRCAHTNSNDYEEICSPVHAHQTYEPTRMNQTDTPDKTSWKSVVLSFFQFVQGVFHQSACK